MIFFTLFLKKYSTTNKLIQKYFCVEKISFIQAFFLILCYNQWGLLTVYRHLLGWKQSPDSSFAECNLGNVFKDTYVGNELERDKKALFKVWSCCLHKKYITDIYTYAAAKPTNFQSYFWISLVTFHPVPKITVRPLQIKGRGGMIPNILYVLFPLEVTGAPWTEAEPLQNPG